MRARLEREHGSFGNQAIWEGPVVILGDSQCDANGFDAMDQWLASIEKDKKKGSIAHKIVRDKPADLSDRCYDGAGQQLTDKLCGQTIVPTYRTPRVVAGDAITTDANKCRLKPMDRNDAAYGSASFTGAQWSQLEAIFPKGVCDFSKPGVDQQGDGGVADLPARQRQGDLRREEAVGPAPRDKRKTVKKK